MPRRCGECWRAVQDRGLSHLDFSKPRDNVPATDGSICDFLHGITSRVQTDNIQVVVTNSRSFFLLSQDNSSFSVLLIIGSDNFLYFKINYIFHTADILYSCILTVVFAKYITYLIIFVTVCFIEYTVKHGE